MKNLIEGLQDEMNRVRELIKTYKELPNNVGMIGAAFMEKGIKQAEKAISEGDTVKMLICYEALKSCE